MKKVVLLTGVLAAGLAATPVVANAAAPSSPKLQEANKLTAQDPVDVFNDYAGQIAGRFDDIAGTRDQIKNALAPFTKQEMTYKDEVATEVYDYETKTWVKGTYTYGLDHEFAGEGFKPADGDWHPKAKAEALQILDDFEHELHNMELALTELWGKYTSHYITADEFFEALENPYTATGADYAVTLSKIMTRDYADNILPVRLKKLNKDWNIFTEYQELGDAKWGEYFDLTQKQAFKEVNETYDVVNVYKVEEKSNQFRLFYEQKHANRKNHIGEDNRTFCDGDCCEDSKNLDKIKELYAAFCAEHKAELDIVMKYQADRESLLKGEKGLSAIYKTYRADFDPTTIQSKATPKNPGADSNEATLQIKAQKTKIENAKKATEDFIRTFNAAGKTFAQWNEVVPKWDGEGKDFTRGSETKHLDNPNYNAEATQQLVDLENLIKAYDALIAAAEKNRDNYDAIVADIKGTDDWNAKGLKHDADKFAATDAQNEHNNVKYYESEAFDVEVPAARQAALSAAEQAYEQFKLKTDAEVTTFKTGNTSAVDTPYEKYKDMVDRANKNEKAHDALHKTLDPLKETYQALLDEYAKLVDGLLVNDNADHKNITAADVKELYPNNADHEYAKAIEKAKKNADAVKADLVNAYNKATSKTEDYYDLGTAYVEANDAELRGYYKTLDTKNGDFRKAIDKAIDNEVAFLEGAHAYDAALAQAHHDLDEYAHHPETFGHWNTEIDAVLAKFPPVLAELIKKYDVEADARNYVKDVLPGVLQGLAKDVADLEQLIKDNQTARDANEAAINATLTDLAALKKKYDETHFTTEEDKTGEATALKADFQKAWKDYVANDLQVPALFVAPATESDLHFAQTAKYADDVKVEDIDFDADIQAMLSAIKSENSIDFDIHHQATDDYALNLAAVKYLKDVVIPALDKKFDELVKANEDAHKAQYDAYAALEKGYDCYNTTGLKAAVNGIATPDYAINADDHGTADTTVANALKTYKDQIDNSYIAGSAKADQANIDGKKNAYVTALNHAKTNDSTFMTEYGKYTTELAKVKYDAKNWLNNYYDDKGNKCSNTANTNVANAYNAMVTAANNYLANIKTDWYENKAKENIADNAGLLKKYTDAVAVYNKAVEDAKANDTEFGNELKALDKLIPLTPYNGKVAKTSADANLKELLKDLEELEPKCNAAKYNAVLADMVSDWEKEDLIKAAVASANNTAISDYKANAAKYNALMAEVNKCATYQAALTAAKAQIEALPVVKDQLAIDGVDKKWDKDRDALINDKTGLQWIQNAIETLEKGIDTAYHNGTKYPTNAQIATDIENLKKKATAENTKYVENEKAFEPLHDNLNNVIAYAENTAHIANPAKEAFEKAVAGYVKTLGELVDQLETAYLNEEAAKVKAEIEKKLADLKKKIEDCKKLAEKLGKTLGDVTKDGEFDEWDSTGSNPDGIVETVLYNRPYNERGDMDLNGRNDVFDINILNDLLWYQSVYGAKKANADVEFEGSIELMVAGNTVGLALNNNTAVTGIQFDVTVPEGSTLSSVIGTARVDGLNVMSAMIDENTYRVLVVSLGASKVINGNDGNIVSFNVSGFGEVEVSNVIVAANASIELNGASVSLGQTTGIDEVESSYDTEIFGLDGIRQSVMKTGVNIVRGANGLVKKILNK